jgi:hypothetical protein
MCLFALASCSALLEDVACASSVARGKTIRIALVAHDALAGNTSMWRSPHSMLFAHGVGR